MDDTKTKQKEFFNRAAFKVRDMNRKKTIDTVKAIVNNCRRYGNVTNRYNVFYSMFGDVKGKSVAEIGCGISYAASVLGYEGAVVFGCDIAFRPILSASYISNTLGLNNVYFILGDGEKLPFRNNSLDIVYTLVSLHHMDVLTAIKEVYRALKGGGRFIAIEPFSGSKVMRVFRKFIPLSTRESPGGRQLLEEDLGVIDGIFQNTNIYYFELFTRLERLPLLKYFQPILREYDSILLRKMPGFSKFARTVVIEAEKK
jgi:ubiquinone/menaquinone biosynthesis C-methylase UbiE